MSDQAAYCRDRDEIRRIIAGAIEEVDVQQIAVTRRLTPAQRFREGLSMIRLAEQVGAYRLRREEDGRCGEAAHRPVEGSPDLTASRPCQVLTLSAIRRRNRS